MAYATVDELTDWLERNVPPNAQRLLDRASRDIDRTLLTALFDITDTDVLATLKEATLEQVAWRLERGEPNGIAHPDQSGVPSGLGGVGVTLTRPGGAAVGAATSGSPRIGDQVVTVLQSQDKITWIGPITWAGG